MRSLFIQKTCPLMLVRVQHGNRQESDSVCQTKQVAQALAESQTSLAPHLRQLQLAILKAEYQSDHIDNLLETIAIAQLESRTLPPVRETYLT